MLEFLDAISSNKEAVNLIVVFIPTLFFLYLLFRFVVEPSVRLFAKLVSVNDDCAKQIQFLVQQFQSLRQEISYLREFCLRRGKYNGDSK